VTQKRPAFALLAPIEEGEVVVRIVRASGFYADRQVGLRLDTSQLPEKEFKANDESYGLSVFVRSALSSGNDDDQAIEALEGARPQWKEKGSGYSFVAVAELRELGLDVRLSPQDCQIEGLVNAHASVSGVTKANRPKLLNLIDNCLSRPPRSNPS
jgi:hypothetical protein